MIRKTSFIFLCIISLAQTVYAGKGAYIKFHNYTDRNMNLQSKNIDNMKNDSVFSKILAPGKIYKKYIEAKGIPGASSAKLKILVNSINHLYIYLDKGKIHFHTKDYASKSLNLNTHIHKDKQDTIHIYMTKNVVKKDYSTWMSDSTKIQNSTLKEITIVGAHDAGMGTIGDCTAIASKNTTQTQNKSFYKMLETGVRYFDIRPVVTKNGLYLGHFSWVDKANISSNQGCVGYSINKFLGDVKEFLDKKSGKHEVIILKFDHFINLVNDDVENSKFDNEDYKKLKDKIKKKLGKYLVYNNSNFLNTKIRNLTKSGPKVIIVSSRRDTDGINGIYKLSYLDLYDKYSNTNDFKRMKENQFKKLDNKNSHDKKYFLLSWTLTQDLGNQVISTVAPIQTIKDLAKIANSHYHLINIYQKVRSSKKYPNILYFDFVKPFHNKIALDINDLRP